MTDPFSHRARCAVTTPGEDQVRSSLRCLARHLGAGVFERGEIPARRLVSELLDTLRQPPLRAGQVVELRRVGYHHDVHRDTVRPHKGRSGAWFPRAVRVSTPVGRLPWQSVVLANVVFWPAWTLAVGYLAARVPRHRFAGDNVMTRIRAVERDGAWYRDQLGIHQWKDGLPEAGALFGDFAKREVARDREQLELFAEETRRAEQAHWAMAAGAVLTAAWNPWWAFPVNVYVGGVANLPCIAVQRYNRARLLRLLARTTSVR